MSQTPSKTDLPVTPGRMRRARGRAPPCRGGATRRPRRARRRRRTCASCRRSRRTRRRAARCRSRSARRRGARPSPRWWPIDDCGPCETMKSSQLAPCSTKTPRIAVFTRSLVSGSPSSSSTPSPFGCAPRDQVARRAHRRPRPRPARGGCPRARRRTSRGGGGRRLAVGRQLDAGVAEPVGEQQREARGHGRLLDAERRARARSAISSKSSTDAIPLRRSSSRPNSSSGCSSKPSSSCSTRDLHRADHDVPVAVPLDVEERIGHERCGISWRSSGERTVSA